MDTDLREQLDRSFGDGPPIDDLDLLLDRGRAAVRRRRLFEGGSVLLVAAAVTVIALVSTGGTAPSSSPGPAGPPTSTSAPVVPDPSPDVVPVITEDRLADRLHELASPAVALQRDGIVHVQPGVDVVRTIAHPFGEQSSSAAVEYVLDGTTYWYVGVDTGDLILNYRTRAKAGTFPGWVASRNPVEVHAVVTNAEGDQQ